MANRRMLALLATTLFLAACSAADQTLAPAPETSARGSETDMTPNKAISSWSSNADLFTTDPLTQLSLQAQFAETGYYTVQFGVTPPTLPVGDPVFDCVADVSWAVEGNTIRRTVSVGNGVSLSGGGQSVKVVVRDQTPAGFGRNMYNVSASITKGTRPSVNQPATLRGFPQVQTCNAGLSIALAIPQDAGVISVETTAGVNSAAALPITAVIIQKNAAGQILKQYDPNTQSGFVSIAPNATQIEFVNLSAGDNYRFQFTWGIDG